MKAPELRALPVNELEAKRNDLKEEYLRLRCGHVSRQLADVIMIKKTRRNIARINTVLNENKSNFQKKQKQMSKLKLQSGVVVSNNMDKSIVVKIERKIKHPIYKKTIKRSKKYIAHDEKNECQIGDLVQIAECRPLSKRKRFRLYKRIK